MKNKWNTYKVAALAELWGVSEVELEHLAKKSTSQETFGALVVCLSYTGDNDFLLSLQSHIKEYLPQHAMSDPHHRTLLSTKQILAVFEFKVYERKIEQYDGLRDFLCRDVVWYRPTPRRTVSEFKMILQKEEDDERREQESGDTDD